MWFISFFQFYVKLVSKLQTIHCHIVLHNLDNGLPYYKNEAIITLYMYTQTDFPLCENEI